MTEWNAAEYARRSGLQEAMAAEVLALLNLAGAERVLDIGRGDGKITAEVGARVPRGAVVGVDSSQEMKCPQHRATGLSRGPIEPWFRGSQHLSTVLSGRSWIHHRLRAAIEVRVGHDATRRAARSIARPAAPGPARAMSKSGETKWYSKRSTHTIAYGLDAAGRGATGKRV